MPDESDPKVKTFGPGVHIGGENGRIELKDGETLYLKAGAFVKGGIYASGNNIRICGRGVLDSSPWGWRSGPTSYVVWMKGPGLRHNGACQRRFAGHVVLQDSMGTDPACDGENPQ